MPNQGWCLRQDSLARASSCESSIRPDYMLFWIHQINRGDILIWQISVHITVFWAIHDDNSDESLNMNDNPYDRTQQSFIKEQPSVPNMLISICKCQKHLYARYRLLNRLRPRYYYRRRCPPNLLHRDFNFFLTYFGGFQQWDILQIWCKVVFPLAEPRYSLPDILL